MSRRRHVLAVAAAALPALALLGVLAGALWWAAAAQCDAQTCRDPCLAMGWVSAALSMAATLAAWNLGSIVYRAVRLYDKEQETVVGVVSA